MPSRTVCIPNPGGTMNFHDANQRFGGVARAATRPSYGANEAAMKRPVAWHFAKPRRAFKPDSLKVKMADASP
ncbi:hypothetical protein [Burkholderia arboris]|uniref:hypothetical protein n=1 Tax=Burkholderia arboris TaxID=488730 RepID=UPI0030F20F19